MNRPLQLPDVPSGGYMRGSVEARRHAVTLKGRQLQVFVRVSQIHLVSHDLMGHEPQRRL